YPQPLIRAKEEQRVRSNRAAEGAAEITLSQLRLRQPGAVGKPVVGVERIVAEVPEAAAVKRVSAGFGDDRHLRAWRTPELRRKRRRLNAKFLEGIDRD